MKLKKIIAVIPGKGGSAKSSTMQTISEWLISRGNDPALLDFDTEVKGSGSFSHWFPQATKVDVNVEGALDVLIERLETHDIVVADCGGNTSHLIINWFEGIFDALQEEMEVEFIAVGVVTDEEAAVRSVIEFGKRIGHKAKYLIVESRLNRSKPDEHFWLGTIEADEFREEYKPAIIRIENRLMSLETFCRNYGVTLGAVAERRTTVPELRKMSMVVRAQSYQRAIYEQLNAIEPLLTV